MALPGMKRAELVEVTTLTHDVIEMLFAMREPETLSFQAGQFISIAVPPVGDLKQVLRSYSIASAQGDGGTFRLCVKLIPGGRASTYFSELQLGDEISFLGAFGHFIVKRPDIAKVFIATGTGLAPFKAMTEQLLSEDTHAEISVLFGVRHEKDLFYTKFFSNKESSRVQFLPTISRPELDVTSVGTILGLSLHTFVGRVTTLLEKNEWYKGEKDFYICGNGSMIDSVRELLLSKGIPPARIIFEKYNNL